RFSQFLLLIGGVAMVATGVFLFAPPASADLYVPSRWIHAVGGGIVLPLVFLWHLVEGLTRSRRALLYVFNPLARFRLFPLVAFAIVAAVTTSLLLGGWPGYFPWRNLVAKKVDPAVTRVSDLAELPWDSVDPLVVGLASGSGFEHGHTDLTLRAMHDGEELFVLAQWHDETESRIYWPWEKTEDGWKHFLTSKKDETVYYEDKFSLVFPVKPEWQFDRFGCAMTCHVGEGYPYGYKGCERTIDVWHWKSTRTDPVGQCDDKYWSTIDFDREDIGRYGDPKESGGYIKNLTDDGDHPPYLPDSLSVVRQGMMPTEHAVEYTAEAAEKFATGAVIPGIVASPFVGDRGDVSCQSTHANGVWTVFLRRKLETGSEYDTQFVPGEAYAFSCAAFNCAAKRHAYNMAVYRLVLEP
ncbi:MAG TPA: ethylbenzene dehydrogenase-related protein, partial [Thermoguttaceae bacterium]|nr:ethylbenzene dehydrogenase-related protein [Thermoguttaceae bacterium]